MLEKLKPFLANDTAFYSVLLVLIALASFGLGRQSVVSQGGGVSVENKGNIERLAPAPPVPAPTATSTPEITPKPATQPASAISVVVGSKSGTKYHLPDCPGAKRIKPENLISFESIEAAKAAGYTPAANCSF